MKIISVQDSEFRRPIEDAIANGIKLVLWHQFPSSGGFQEWFLIYSLHGLDKVISKGQVASAFTAYEWIEVLSSQKINQTWLEQTRAMLEQESQNHMLLIKSLSQEDIEPIQLTWAGELDDIQEYYEDHGGSGVVVGRIPSVWFGEITRGYYPDENGNPQSAPY
jgi:hypothetical protein